MEERGGGDGNKLTPYTNVFNDDTPEGTLRNYLRRASTTRLKCSPCGPIHCTSFRWESGDKINCVTLAQLK